MHIATATVPGSTHVNAGQPGKINNQDAISTRSNGKKHVTVLCDGCGSQPHSGTGADIGANLISQTIFDKLCQGSLEQLDWQAIAAETEVHLRTIAGIFALNGSTTAFEQAVVERFLFTAIILIIEDDKAAVVSFGDCVIVIDDEVVVLEPPILNSPPYFGYRLLKNSAYHAEELKPHLAFSVLRTINLSELKKSLIVATDGFASLLDEDLHHPALVQPKSLQRWLNVVTTEKIHQGMLIPGKCQDDASLIMVRTDESQQKLFESRLEIAQLKQDLLNLQVQFTNTTEDLKRTELDRDKAEEQVDYLNSEIDRLRPKALKLDMFERELTILEGKIATMRNKLPAKARSILSTFEPLFKILFPPKTPATVVTPKPASQGKFGLSVVQGGSKKPN